MIVLDTHAWIWWAAGSRELSAPARHAIDGADGIGICAISLWEVSMLVAKGRLEFDRDPLEWMKQALALPRVELLPLTPDVAVEAAALGTEFHGDPADRLVVATALDQAARLITRDLRIRRSGVVRTVW